MFLNILSSPIFLNIGTNNHTIQQNGKQDSIIHILKSSTSMYGSSGSQFVRTTAGMESRIDSFDKPSLNMTFAISLGVTEILCSFRSVFEGKIGK